MVPRNGLRALNYIRYQCSILNEQTFIVYYNKYPNCAYTRT